MRMIEPTGPEAARTAETRFNRYFELDGGWVAPELEFLVDGARAFLALELRLARRGQPPRASLMPRSCR